ncbi:MAG: SAM-dependent methyltransferase, partial [Limisphaerales bacterium]
MSELSDITENYYDSDDADRFYYHIWGGEDIHIGLYEEGESDIRLASRRTVEAMATKLKHWPGGTRLLDIGAGYGGSGRYLIKEHRFDVTSLNLSKIQNQRNREFNQLQGLCSQHVVVDGNFESLPFREATFDLVWSQ